MKSGEIKATAVNEPFTSMAREQGFNVLFDLVPEQIPWLFTAIVVRRGAIADRRDVLTRFIRATAEGNYLALTDEKRAKAVLAKQAGITDPKILDISYNDFKLLSPPNIEPSDAAAKNILAQFPDASQKVEDYVDSGILDTLRKDGVFTALAQKYQRCRRNRRMALKFRVELVWEGEKETASSIYLTGGRPGDPARPRDLARRSAQTLSLPADGDMISVDRNLIRAIKEML